MWKLSLPWTIGLSVLAITFIPEFLLFYVKRFTSMKTRLHYLNEVMFFTDKSANCKDHCFKKNICKKEGLCSYRHLSRLVELFESSTTKLDICIYLFTCWQITDAIIKAKRKGVMVRVIADHDMTECSGQKIDILRNHGIFVQTKKSPFLMHHKFALIDDKILITGSCNWTMQGITGNWDNIIITSVPEIVQPFRGHFSELWNEFSNIKIYNGS